MEATEDENALATILNGNPTADQLRKLMAEQFQLSNKETPKEVQVSSL